MAQQSFIGFDQFTHFSRDLEHFCRADRNFMDVGFLYLVRDAFGYQTATLSYYPQKKFCGVEVVGKLNEAAAKEEYLRRFQKRDPFAAHIGTTRAKDPNVTMLQSSTVFQRNYFSSEYYRFLHTYGVSYALTLPFDDYRLTLYKHENEGDFTQQESDALCYLGTLLRNRHATHREMAFQRTAVQSQAQLLDSLGIGFLCADSRLTVHICNQFAKQYLVQVGGRSDVRENVSWLYNQIKKLGKRNMGQHPSMSMELQHCTVTLEIVREEQMAAAQFFITIYPQSRTDTMETAQRKYGLSDREAEVVRALVEGKSYQEAAQSLYISINTVRTHVKNIYKKTGISNQRALGQMFR